jgi:hypothetical protein
MSMLGPQMLTPDPLPRSLLADDSGLNPLPFPVNTSHLPSSVRQLLSLSHFRFQRS